MNWVSTGVGLGLALGGPALVAGLGEQCFSNSDSLTSKLLQQMVLAALLGAVIGVVVVWEQQPVSVLGLQAFRWQSVLWGVGFAGFLIFAYSPMLMWVINKLGMSGFGDGLAQLAPLPIWYLTLAVVIGGIVEEGLYRGYATERLALLTGSYWFGSILALAAFGLAHVPLWGWGASITTVLSGAILTGFYLGTGDLLTVIIAHVMTDTVGIIVMPVLARTR